MRFSCEGCSAKYMISDDKVGPAGVKVRCKKCGHVTLVRRGEPEVAAAPAPAGPLAGEWWVAIGEQPVGPVGVEVLQHHWNQGEIGPESLVWYPALPEWAPLSSVPELHSHLGGGMPVAPPAAAPLSPADPPPPAPDEEWRPGAASALAALEDTHSRDVDLPADGTVAGPDARAAAAPTPTEGHGIGTDPTGVKPLPMAGLERTGESRLSVAPGPRGQWVRQGAAEPRESRSLTVVLLAALAIVAVVAAGLWWMTK